MKSRRERQEASPGLSRTYGASNSISLLVGEVYQEAPPIERTRLLEHLMRPLGVLSLAVVANGVFSKMRFLSGWPELRIRPEDIDVVRTDDVIALVDYVQQASTEVIDGLVQLVSTSPVLTGSAAAALLITVLVQRARSNRRGETHS
jgi:hypothetical protein